MSNNDGKKLAGKIAVITGGSSGMALAGAKRFVEEARTYLLRGVGKNNLIRLSS